MTYTSWPPRLVLMMSLLLPGFVQAEDVRGQVTNLPLPRFVSMKSAEGNVRRGPSVAHRVDWIFKRRNMPVQIIAEYGHWRRVVDRDGAGGWMHYSLLSGARTVIVETDMMPLYAKPDHDAHIEAYAETGVVASLSGCVAGWCELTVGSEEGWAEMAHLWGVMPADNSDR